MEVGTVETAGDFVAQLAALEDDRASSDFTINCGDNIYKVHRLVLRIHSGYFARLFKSDFEENRESRITLAEDHCSLVRCMVKYFYHFNYVLYNDDFIPMLKPDEAPSGMPPQDQALPSSELRAHAYMYTLAEKYDIPGLKRLSKDKFESEGKSILSEPVRWTSGMDRALEDTVRVFGGNEEREPDREGFIQDLSESTIDKFLDVIPFVYENTAPNEMGLRDSIVKIWSNGSEELKKFTMRGAWAELLEKYPELGVDMIMGLRAHDKDEEDDQEAGSSSGGSFIAETTQYR